MSINKIIENAVGDLVSGNIWPLCCPLDSPPDCYIVYNPELEEPGLYADDEDCDWVHYMQVHLYTKGNYINLRKTIRSALRNAGFSVTGIETLYEKDTKYYHLCFECWMEEQ